MVSLGLLVFLLIYPILVIILAKSSYANQQYSFQSVSEIMSFEKEMSKIMSFLVLTALLRTPATRGQAFLWV